MLGILEEEFKSSSFICTSNLPLFFFFFFFLFKSCSGEELEATGRGTNWTKGPVRGEGDSEAEQDGPWPVMTSLNHTCIS